MRDIAISHHYGHIVFGQHSRFHVEQGLTWPGSLGPPNQPAETEIEMDGVPPLPVDQVPTWRSSSRCRVVGRASNRSLRPLEPDVRQVGRRDAPSLAHPAGTDAALQSGRVSTDAGAHDRSAATCFTWNKDPVQLRHRLPRSPWQVDLPVCGQVADELRGSRPDVPACIVQTRRACDIHVSADHFRWTSGGVERAAYEDRRGQWTRRCHAGVGQSFGVT